ncbi:MAG TPA: class I SAM-dependent methyltransferase [Gaiellaceae bacterium]|nr:class I SAM-dependent methyltransferase [Gaiellaceae bacterium]
MSLHDPEAVRRQYASEDNLRARQALYDDVSGPDPHDVLWRTLLEWEPQIVLEVGGGPGELAERMQTDLAARVSYVDISPRMVELAQARGVDGQVGDVQDLPFADETFDTVVAAWMLYHVPDIDRGLGEIARVLRPGGALIAVTNSVSHLGEFRSLVAYPPGFEERFNRENGVELLRGHFAKVAQHDLEITVTVHDRSQLVAYQQSMSMPTQPVPEAVEIPFVTYSRPTIFFATK